MIDPETGKLISLGLIFMTITLVGFFLAYLYGHKTKYFRWDEYLALVLWSMLFVVVLANFLGPRILSLFALSCFVGIVFEYILGLAYHKRLNKRLWTYS